MICRFIYGKFRLIIWRLFHEITSILIVYLVFHCKQVLLAFNTLKRAIASCLRSSPLLLSSWLPPFLWFCSTNRHVSINWGFIDSRHGCVVLCEILLLLITHLFANPYCPYCANSWTALDSVRLLHKSRSDQAIFGSCNKRPRFRRRLLNRLCRREISALPLFFPSSS